MLTKRIFGIIALLFIFVHAGNAQGTDDISKYFNETAVKVAETEDPVQKREILSNSFETMLKALDGIERSGLIRKDDLAGLDLFRAALQEKQDELAGNNGFAPVPDGQLNAFANYVVQDMEQAAQSITISLVAALLILIVVILLVS